MADTAHILFSSEGPARFELMVDDKGNVVLFGYTGLVEDQEQEPGLAYDTDGSGMALEGFKLEIVQ